MKVFPRAFLFFLALVLLPASAFSADAAPQTIVVNKIAAVVNGEMITLHELRQHAGSEFVRMGINPMDPAARSQVNTVMSKVLSVMIDELLLRQEAERLQIKVSESDVDNEVRKIIQRNQTTEKEFEARLAAQGGSMDMLKERVRNGILSQRIIAIMIARKSTVSSEEIKNYYEAHKSDFEADRSVDISLIVFSPSSNPQDIASRITKGTMTFEEAAKKFSEGPAPENGGRIGMVKWDDLASPIKAQLVEMKKGQTSVLFPLSGRDCLLKFNDAQSGRSMTLEEATPEIERILREPRMQERFTEYTQELRSRAVIDIRL